MAKKKALGLKNYTHPDRYGELLGFVVEKLDARRKEAVLSLELGERHLSPAGRVHGGVVSGFFDTACGAAIFTTVNKGDFASTVELKVNYFRPLEKGDKLRCVAKVVFLGRRLRAVQAYLYRGRGKEPVAMASGTFYIVPGKAERS